MIELRWVVKEPSYPSHKILQYRMMLGDGFMVKSGETFIRETTYTQDGVSEEFWSEWKDVPTVVEK